MKSVDKQMSQIEHLERLVASLRIENKNLDKKLSISMSMYDSEKRRADLLQIDLNSYDDFMAITMKEIYSKFSRREH